MERLRSELTQLGDDDNGHHAEARPRNMEICIWCANKTAEVCIAKCQPEGKYRYLQPEAPEQWEPGPRLPPMRKLVDMPASERLAVIYLQEWYAERERTRDP